MTALELLQELNTLDEHPRVEAKTGSEAGKAVLRTVSAYANEPGLGGGHIIFGLAPSDDLFGERYQVVGVPDPDQLQADLASQCRTMFNRPIRPSLEVEVLDGRAVVTAFVAEAPTGHKPVYFKKQGLPRGAYRRIGSSDQRCTDDDLLVLYDARRHKTFDRDPMPEAELSELDSDALSDYRRERARAHPGAEELSWSDEELLLGIGCAVREAGRVVPTVAGVLLFGGRPLLRRLFPMLRLDYVRVPGREWIEDPERRFDTIDMRDPIIRLIRRGEAAILDDLPKQFNLPPGELQRRDVPKIPERVIREALVNALMHRSYRRQGPTQIIRYSNRIEIRNPGHSLKAEDRLGEPGSETRNPAIAAVLHETDYAETKGSGIRVMRQLMRDMDLALPTFESNRDADEFVATLYLHNLLDDEDLAWLGRFGDANLSTDEAQALVHVREAGKITNADYRDLCGADTLEASSHLRRLRDLGLVEQHDRGAATFYTPTPRLLGESEEEPDKGAEKRSKAAEKPSKDSEKPSKEPGEQSIKHPPKPHKPPEKPHKAEGEPSRTWEESVRSALPPDLAESIDELNRWTPQVELRRLIVRLCAWQPMTAAELTQLLGRSRTYLRNAYIGPMIKNGDLEYTNPQNPRDSEQRYRAKGDDR